MEINKEKHKLLVIDDTKDIIFSIKIVLRKYNIEVIGAGNGEEGIEKAIEIKPDLIILDVEMPGINGFETCNILKTKVETRKIPIMFLTGRFIDVKDKVDGLNMGADDYLIKPFNNFELAARVNVMLRLKDAYDALEKKNGHYMRILSDVSHDLKNPLTSIIGGTETLKNNILGELNEQQLNMLNIIYKNEYFMLDMIEHYFNLSKLEKGEMTVNVTEFDFVADALNPILNLMNPLFDDPNPEKHRTLIKEESLDKLILKSDVNHLKMILNNLFSNAYKYSDENGTIKYGLSLKDSNLCFYLWNSGNGINEERINSVFEKFERIHDSISRKQKGTGLGLYNTKEVIKLLNGNILCESDGISWTKFSFEIPLEVK